VSIFPLLLIIFTSFLVGILARGRWRGWFLMLTSILAIYWLQPATPIRHLDFWLPTASIVFTVFSWILTNPRGIEGLQKNLTTLVTIFVVLLIISLSRYVDPLCCLTPTIPPSFDQVILTAAIITAIIFLSARFISRQTAWISGLTILIIVVFVVIKFEPLAKFASTSLRSLNSQSTELASALDIRWLGFSYVAFRLMHTLRDRLQGKLPDLTLMEFVIYVIFYPAYTAGPIDRVQRFTQDLHREFLPSIDTYFQGGKRIFIGVFNKFVLADGLAIIALNSTNANQANTSVWLWIMLYAFAFRIYFDFSGYTDIAIGMGQLLGIQLPENFERPYRKPNLTLFWNSWHITLAQWFRSYFFNPLTRSLRSSPRNLSLPLIIFVGQISTFVLIGLWHGITWNFAIWGAWHGLGLFFHNRWSNMIRTKSQVENINPTIKRFLGYGSTFLTFNYVSLGWVWFALVTPGASWNFLLKLFGWG
jgi:alginate O-acetyltransferase complex protein AlgI